MGSTALRIFTKEQLRDAGPADLSDALERSCIVHFPECPIDLPDDSDLEFLRTTLPNQIRRKNVSYHPELERLAGLKADGATRERTCRILLNHRWNVQRFLKSCMPCLTADWTVGTTSFRPMQERGRTLSPRASNELVHVDAGAYGATHGDRILRFFVNVNAEEDRVWRTKGGFQSIYQRLGRGAGVLVDEPPPSHLSNQWHDDVRAWFVRRARRAGLPFAHVLDSSPYDRAMRQLHNHMKDSGEFQGARDDVEEIAFAPFSAWMVLTDTVSHACRSGQHAFVDTFVIRLASCRLPELAPINILRAPANDTVTPGQPAIGVG